MGVQWGLPQCSSESLTLIHESQDILGSQGVPRETVFSLSPNGKEMSHIASILKQDLPLKENKGWRNTVLPFDFPLFEPYHHHPCSNGLLSSFVLPAAYPAFFGSGHGDSSLSTLACLIVPSFLVNSIEPLLKMYGHYFQRLSKNTALT